MDITPKDRDAVAKLVKQRNRLQHFGFTGNASEVENLAGEVLDFLIRFIDDHLLPYLKDTQQKAEAESMLLNVRAGLTSIDSLVKERMNRLGGELKEQGVENRTVECPARSSAPYASSWPWSWAAIPLPAGSVRVTGSPTSSPVSSITAAGRIPGRGRSGRRSACRPGAFATVAGA
ncbi:hypothetical protein ACWC9U_38840 [Streptomyces sp. 900116325]